MPPRVATLAEVLEFDQVRRSRCDRLGGGRRRGFGPDEPVEPVDGVVGGRRHRPRLRRGSSPRLPGQRSPRPCALSWSHRPERRADTKPRNLGLTTIAAAAASRRSSRRRRRDQGSASVASSNGCPTRIPATTGSVARGSSSKPPFWATIRNGRAVLPGVPRRQPARAAACTRWRRRKPAFSGFPTDSRVTAAFWCSGPGHDAFAQPAVRTRSRQRLRRRPGARRSRFPTLLPGPTTTLTTPSGWPARGCPLNSSGLSGVAVPLDGRACLPPPGPGHLPARYGPTGSLHG